MRYQLPEMVKAGSGFGRAMKAGVVANVVVPTPDYVRFATHYRFRPDFCHAQDPESKGIVENLVGYAKDGVPIVVERVHVVGEVGDNARDRGHVDRLRVVAEPGRARGVAGAPAHRPGPAPGTGRSRAARSPSTERSSPSASTPPSTPSRSATPPAAARDSPAEPSAPRNSSATNSSTRSCCAARSPVATTTRW